MPAPPAVTATVASPPLRRDILRRGTATTVPALAAYLLARRFGTESQAGAVAFGTVVAIQLSQTLDAGWSEGNLNRPVLAAVGGSAAFLASTLSLRPLRDLLGLAVPTSAGWTLIGAGAAAAVALSRLLAAAGSERSTPSVDQSSQAGSPALGGLSLPAPRFPVPRSD